MTTRVYSNQTADTPILMMQKKLPTGIQNLSEIINENYYYVDKTAYIHELLRDGKYFFLSRPRRFGKSLFLDTLQQLFEAKRDLFKGLFIEDKWDWSTSYPVIRLSFGSGVLQNREQVDKSINDQLSEIAKRLGVSMNAETIPGRFRQMLLNINAHYGQRVVLLIDEYDKPILDNITKHDIATENREGLKHLYSVIKDADALLKFAFITGVSKFSKVSLFSGLNNLTDITLVPKYSAICGYTDEDVDTVFADQIRELDRAAIKDWYNGYNWRGTAVYNPFDLLLLFGQREFKPYWFETATPTFLTQILKERQFFSPNFELVQANEALLSRFDVDNIGTEALLFQTGYLTITHCEEMLPGKWVYELSYPNKEVQSSLNEALLPALGADASAALISSMGLLKAMRAYDFSAFETHLQALYASIPHDWYRNNPLNNYEGHYASIFYSHFAALGLPVTVEDASLNGKVDMTLEFNHTTFIFEFKVVDDAPTGAALDQIIRQNYAQKYVRDGWRIFGVGVEFSRAKRQIVALDAQEL